MPLRRGIALLLRSGRSAQAVAWAKPLARVCAVLSALNNAGRKTIWRSQFVQGAVRIADHLRPRSAGTFMPAHPAPADLRV